MCRVTSARERHTLFCATDYHLFTGKADSPENLIQSEHQMDIQPTGHGTPTPLSSKPPTNPDPLRQKATELEAAFLAEMLQFAGLGAQGDSFDGGIGEEQFSSFLREEQAKLMAEHGGIGLAEALFEAMVDRSAQQRTAP
jgi:peptidoglycan hydrolase FlgJ